MNSPDYQLYWLDLSFLGYDQSVALGGLPGCKDRYIIRDLTQDKDALVKEGISHVFILCEEEELKRCGVPQIGPILFQAGIQVHFFPIKFGHPPLIEDNLEIIGDVFSIIEQGEKCLIASKDVFGRASCLGATILLHTKDELLYSDAYDSLKALTGPRAIQTIKQYNYLVDFRNLRDDHNASLHDNFGLRCERNVSR